MRERGREGGGLKLIKECKSLCLAFRQCHYSTLQTHIHMSCNGSSAPCYRQGDNVYMMKDNTYGNRIQSLISFISGSKVTAKRVLYMTKLRGHTVGGVSVVEQPW